jgi:hypothetical protein
MDPAPTLYMIRIHGHLGATVLSAFPEMLSQQQGADTVLTGLLDRSALYGVLAEIEALGLDLVEVRKLTPDRTSTIPIPELLEATGETTSPARCHHRYPLPSSGSGSRRQVGESPGSDDDCSPARP